MTDTSTEAIARLMDGVTPGPWREDGPRHSIIVWSDDENRVCFMTSDGPCAANASFIAAASDLVPALAAERDAAIARAERAEAALKAVVDTQDSDGFFSMTILNDAVSAARALLVKYGANK